MKKTLIIVFLLSLVAVADCLTLQECDKEIGALRIELAELQKQPVVRYRRKDSPSSNFDERLKVVEINREYVRLRPAISFGDMRNGANDRAKWEKYRRMVDTSEKNQNRIKEIKARLAYLEREKYIIYQSSVKSVKK